MIEANRVAEIFLQNHKPGSQSDSNARDTAVAAESRPAIRVSVTDAAARGAARCYRSAFDTARRRYRRNYWSGGRQMNLASIHTVTAMLAPRILIHGQEGVGKTTLASKFLRRSSCKPRTVVPVVWRSIASG